MCDSRVAPSSNSFTKTIFYVNRRMFLQSSLMLEDTQNIKIMLKYIIMKVGHPLLVVMAVAPYIVIIIIFNK